MTLEDDRRSLTPGAEVELWEIDLTGIGFPVVERFHAMPRSPGETDLVFDGEVYRFLPIKALGFNTKPDKPPRPTLIVGNVDNAISTLAAAYDDLLGARVTRRITFEQYLDDGNEPDPLAFRTSLWLVSRKQTDTGNSVGLELETPIDVQGVKTPRRIVQPGTCPWLYEAAECGYSNGASGSQTIMLELDDTPTLDPDLDRCGKRLNSCRDRFDPSSESVPIPFGAFPGTTRVLRS